MSLSLLIFLCVLFFAIAVIYSSVGFGGGSSYLALLAIYLVSFYSIRSLALVCNIVVVSGSLYWFYRKGHLQFRQFLPFVVTSIPMAFLGASFRLSQQLFFIILGVVLMVSAAFLIWQSGLFAKDNERNSERFPPASSYLIGACIGLLSGIVGIGGGIFLAPLLHHLKWGPPVKIAALSCFFIFVNSLSGLGGLLYGQTLELPWPEALALALAVLMGGQIGIRYSLKKLSPRTIKITTAFLVFVVGLRVLLVNGLAWV